MLLRLTFALCLMLGLGQVAGAVTFTPASFAFVQARPDAQSVRIDDYVSNPQPGGLVVDTANVLQVVGPFGGFHSPNASYTTQNPLPTAMGIQVESSTGSVTFIDGTFTVSTDLLAGRNAGDTVTLRFVDPADPSRPAAISGLAGVVGSTRFINFLRAYDVHGNEIMTNSGNAIFLPQSSSGTGSFGVEARDDLTNPVSEIHELVFTTNQDDVWVIGSFNLPNTSIDLAISGFTTDIPGLVIPTPSAVLMAAVGLLVVLRRRTGQP